MVADDVIFPCIVFAQEPLFTDTDDAQPGQNYALLREAIRRHGVEVVGSAPYVEATVELAKKNIALILELAGCNGYHADFHLDYNLDPHSEPLIYEVISQAKALSRYWRPTGGLAPRRITIGHATRMQLFTPAQWRDIADAVDDLPIVLVGLPNSDMYMQGREDTDLLLGPPRSTLRVPYIARKYGFQIAMSVNNVENAFTPQGSLDPLALCTLGAGIFQSATPQDIRTLMVPFASSSSVSRPTLTTHFKLPALCNLDFQTRYGPDSSARRLIPDQGRPSRFCHRSRHPNLSAGRTESELRPYDHSEWNRCCEQAYRKMDPTYGTRHFGTNNPAVVPTSSMVVPSLPTIVFVSIDHGTRYGSFLSCQYCN